jgi:hypothetical protein
VSGTTPSMLGYWASIGSSLAAIMRLVAAEQFTVVTMPM